MPLRMYYYKDNGIRKIPINIQIPMAIHGIPDNLFPRSILRFANSKSAISFGFVVVISGIAILLDCTHIIIEKIIPMPKQRTAARIPNVLIVFALLKNSLIAV